MLKDSLDEFLSGLLLILLFALACLVFVGTVFLFCLATSYGTVYEQNNCYEKTQSATCFESKTLF